MDEAGVVFLPAVGSWEIFSEIDPETEIPHGYYAWSGVGYDFFYYSSRGENAAGGNVPMLDLHTRPTGLFFYSAPGMEHKDLYYQPARLVYHEYIYL